MGVATSVDTISRERRTVEVPELEERTWDKRRKAKNNELKNMNTAQTAKEDSEREKNGGNETALLLAMDAPARRQWLKLAIWSLAALSMLSHACKKDHRI